MNEKIDEQLQAVMKKTIVRKIVDSTAQFIMNFTHALMELKKGLRECFKDNIYVIQIDQTETSISQGSSMQTLIHLEVVRPDDFMALIKDTIKQASNSEFVIQIDSNLQKSIMTVFQSDIYNQLIVFSELQGCLKKLDFKERLPKMTNVNFRNLDRKSIRILNRINEHLQELGYDVDKMLESLIGVKKLKIKDGEAQEMQCLGSIDFFNMIHYIGIRKSPDVYEPLQNILALSTQSQSLLKVIPLSKLLNVLAVFRKSPYFLAYGTRKRKLDYLITQQSFSSSKE